MYINFIISPSVFSNVYFTLFTDHTSGRVFWMDYFSSQINSMSADGKDRRSHDFINYYKTITMPYSGETFKTLDKWMRYAYKVCINYDELFIRMYK